ncbi:MAG: sulfate ABC transporter permease [Flavobacterium sp.]|nr:sulfate ABC transporter permease [Flavobacterium sp.]
MKKYLKAKFLNQFLFIVIVLLPVLAGLIFAILYSLGLIGFLNSGFNWLAWNSVLTDFYFWKSIAFSLYVGLVSVSISAIISFLLAFYWHDDLKNGLLSIIIYLPLCFPATVMAFFIFQMLSQSGFISRIFFKIHLTDSISNFPELINDLFGIGIIFTMIALITPFFIILFSTIYQEENINQLSQLSTTLGADKKFIFMNVIVPVIIKKSSVSLILFVIFVMGNYEVPLILGRQNPQMISVAIVQKIQRFNLYDIPKGYTMSLIYVFFLLIILGYVVLKHPNFFKNKS